MKNNVELSGWVTKLREEDKKKIGEHLLCKRGIKVPSGKKTGPDYVFWNIQGWNEQARELAKIEDGAGVVIRGSLRKDAKDDEGKEFYPPYIVVEAIREESHSNGKSNDSKGFQKKEAPADDGWGEEEEADLPF